MKGFLITVRDSQHRQVLGFADVEAVGIVERHSHDGEALRLAMGNGGHLEIKLYTRKDLSLWKRMKEFFKQTLREAIAAELAKESERARQTGK